MERLVGPGEDALAALMPPAPPGRRRALLVLVQEPTTGGEDTDRAHAERVIAMPDPLRQLVGAEASWVTGRLVEEVLPGLEPRVLRAVGRTGRPAVSAGSVIVRLSPGSTDHGSDNADIEGGAGAQVLVLPARPPADGPGGGRGDRSDPEGPGDLLDPEGPVDPGEPLFELTFSGAAIGMAVTCSGIVVRANRALADLLGRHPEDLVGLSLDAISAPDTATAHPPERPGSRARPRADAEPAPGAPAPAPDRPATGWGWGPPDGPDAPDAPAGADSRDRGDHRRGDGAQASPAHPFVHSSGRVVWLRVSAAEVALGPFRLVLNHFVDVTGDRRVARQMAHAATHDELTGLPNRTWLLSALQLALGDGSITGMALGRLAPAVLFLDIDDFKAVNDSFGHDAGDRLLRQIAQRLRRAVRPEDAVARFGGDELVVLCETLRDGDATEQLCRRLLTTVAEPVEIDGQAVMVSASIGVAHADPTSTPQSLLREADSAMYAAKRAGRNQYVVSDELLHGFAGAALNEEAELRSALEHRTLELGLVPVRELSTLRITGVDAVLAWRHPVRGLLDPGYCAGLAARTGINRGLGEFVLDEACRRLPAWRAECAQPDLQVTVALSAEHLEHPDVVADVRHALRRHRTDPRSLVVGIGEAALMNDPDAVLTHLEQLVDEGIGLALAGFGAGFSALGLLRALPVAMLTLDRLFVAGAAVPGSRESIMLAGIASLGRALRITVGATGVDTVADLVAVRAAGCTHAQGLVVGPMSPTATWLQPVTPDIGEADTGEGDTGDRGGTVLDLAHRLARRQ